MKLRSRFWTSILIVLLLSASTAVADTSVFTLNVGNSAISGFTGPYATATITLTSSTTADITFNSLTNSGNIYLFGDGSSVDLNVNAAAFTVSPVTGSNLGTGFSPGPLSAALPGNVDGFGLFSLTVDSFDGFTNSSDTVSFTLTNNSGTWADAASVVTPNAGGFSVGAHIFVTASPANAANGALATGFASNGPTSTPEPSSLLLLGAGLASLVGLRRKRHLMAA